MFRLESVCSCGRVSQQVFHAECKVVGSWAGVRFWWSTAVHWACCSPEGFPWKVKAVLLQLPVLVCPVLGLLPCQNGMVAWVALINARPPARSHACEACGNTGSVTSTCVGVLSRVNKHMLVGPALVQWLSQGWAFKPNQLVQCLSGAQHKQAPGQGMGGCVMV